MDGVVPRTRLAEALANVYRMCEERGLKGGNVFHAGDGNLHPHVLFDAQDPAAQQRALETSHEILRMCIRMGGTISGEHGVGLEKRSMMLEPYEPADLEVMERLKHAFNPDGLLNPEKILPGGGACREASPAQMGGMRGNGGGEGPWI